VGSAFDLGPGDPGSIPILCFYNIIERGPTHRIPMLWGKPWTTLLKFKLWVILKTPLV